MTNEYKKLVDPNSEFSLDYLINNDNLTTDDNGHQFFKLQTLLKWKKTMGRQKRYS